MEAAANTFLDFVEVFYHNRFRYRKFAQRFVHNESVAEQIVDDCLLRFCEKREQLISATVESYFYTSIKNGCLNYLKERQREYEFEKRTYERDYRLRQYEIASLDSLIPDHIFSKEIHDIMNRELGLMPELRRSIFLDSRFNYLNYDQIAKKYAVSKIKVKREVSAAVQRLRVALQDYLPILIIISSFLLFG